MQSLINNGKMEVTLQDRADLSLNGSGTSEKIDTPLTQPRSGFDPGPCIGGAFEDVRRDLIAKRVECGADTLAGRTISDLIQLLQEPRTAVVQMLIDSKMDRLERLFKH